jgi:putative membrane-bound dehydrogenase-like protein
MRYTLLLATLLIATPTFAQSSANRWGGAMWVWDEADADKVPQNNDPRFLRLPLDLAAKPMQAELWITADNVYTAYINGQKIGTGVEWSNVDAYDVAKHLVVGKNVLAIQATNQGGVAGAIARLHIKTADKKDMFVVTNEKTKITQKAGKDWLKTDFDESTWFNAVVLGDSSIAPWNLTGGPVVKGKVGDRFGYGSNAVDPNVKARLTAQEQIKHFIVPKDFEIELVAADPVIINPITMVLDAKGRVIVSESHTYRFGPPGSPIKPFANPVVRLDPDGKGGFTRTLVADGFDDPVMGIAVKGNKLWLTANNYLYTYDLPESPGTAVPGLSKPIAINKKAILVDKNKAWNPFGMFVLEWGPDGKLYMSVGDHKIDIKGPDGSISARGNSGMIMRMNPDGTKMERLVHGLRVPYSFEYDPFGQLWLLSNGEGNPDRFVRVIDGVDYHCYSRPGIPNEWLAGRHPLAPPCEDVHGGAHTQLMRYYAAAYPEEYQGNLFCCNWGRHGFAGPNRGIFRFVLDERNNVVKKETLVACTDPHFRPSHIHLDVDGSLLIADWYGRDDESDMTGRIWRLKYVGKNAPVVKHKLDSPEWKNDDYAITALGSPDHLIRQKARNEIAKRGEAIYAKLGEHARSAKEPLGAANAMWTLADRNEAKANLEIMEGYFHADWKVVRLACNIALRYGFASELCVNADKPRRPVANPRRLAIGEDNVVLEFAKAGVAALAKIRVDKKATENEFNAAVSLLLADCLPNFPGVTRDPHLRYEYAWHVAKHADQKSLDSLLTSADPDFRLTGLIAIDIACYEDFETKKNALEALAKALENPGKLDHQLLLMVAQLDGDASIVPALEKLIARDDLPTATIAKAVLVLKAKSGGSLASSKLSAAAGKRLIEAVEKGSLKIASPADQLVIFEFLESEGPTPFALKQIEGQLRSNQPALKQAAHTLARRFGPKASSLADGLWPSVLNPKTKFEDTIDYLSTIARVDEHLFQIRWAQLLEHEDPYVRMEAVRWWRKFDKVPEALDLLLVKKDTLMQKDATVKEDLDTVVGHLKRTPVPAVDKDALTKYALKELDAMPAPDRPKRAAMGLQVFERNACTKCHTTATQTTLLAPSLKGVAAQKVEYLIESVLFPSKIIKTGWEVEQIELKNGKTMVGLVKDEGKHLRVLALDKDERILKSDVESRATSKVSVMPDGQEATMSRREFVDLIAYLQTLK